MGFTIAGPNRFYASGHPGEGTDLPNPVGLIASTDHGRTLETSCPRGVSPTPTRSLPPTGVLGNDGTLLASQDGRQWPDLQLPLPPTALAASPDGRTVLAATDAGLLLSTDAAQTWAAPHPERHH